MRYTGFGTPPTRKEQSGSKSHAIPRGPCRRPGEIVNSPDRPNRGPAWWSAWSSPARSQERTRPATAGRVVRDTQHRRPTPMRSAARSLGPAVDQAVDFVPGLVEGLCPSVRREATSTHLWSA